MPFDPERAGDDMTEKTVKCPICGEPYVAYMHYAGDQSACPSCRYKARKNVVIKSTDNTSSNTYWCKNAV